MRWICTWHLSCLSWKSFSDARTYVVCSEYWLPSFSSLKKCASSIWMIMDDSCIAISEYAHFSLGNQTIKSVQSDEIPRDWCSTPHMTNTISPGSEIGLIVHESHRDTSKRIYTTVPKMSLQWKEITLSNFVEWQSALTETFFFLSFV